MSSSSLFLAIESVDRASGSSHQFTYQLPHSIKNVKRISLINVELPNTCYNVRSPYNTFQFTRSSTTYTATVAEGNYTVTTLLTALATAMTAADSSTTFSFSSSSSTLKITMTSSNSVTIGNTYLSRSLGFVNGQIGTTIVASNTYVIGDTFLFLSLRNLPTNIISTSSSQFRIPLKADSGYIEFYSATDANQQFIDMDGSSLGHLDIVLVDQYGHPVSLNGAEFSMFLRIDKTHGQ
jgi:hypothetical protein